MILYGLGLLALVGTLLGGLNRSAPVRQEGPDSRPESRLVALTHPPRSFASSDVMHQLMTLEDYTEKTRDSAIAATIQYLDTLRGPDSRPAAADWTELDVEQAIAHPDKFRGGLVKIEGTFVRLRTRGIEHPAIPDGVTYRGWLATRVGHENFLVAFETKDRLPDVAKNTQLEVEGVFLQALQYADAKEITRTVPLIVAASVRVPLVEHPQTFLDRIFGPALVVLIILVLATTLFLLHLRKSSQLAQERRYVARPPGPGR